MTAPWTVVSTSVLLGVVLLLAALVMVTFAPKVFGLCINVPQHGEHDLRLASHNLIQPV